MEILASLIRSENFEREVFAEKKPGHAVKITEFPSIPTWGESLLTKKAFPPLVVKDRFRFEHTGFLRNIEFLSEFSA